MINSTFHDWGYLGLGYVIPHILLPKSPDNMPPHFAQYTKSKAGRGLTFEYSISLNYMPPQTRGATESHDGLPIPNQRNSSNIGDVPQEFFQVCWYFLQKSGSEIMCIISGDRRDWVVRMCVYVFKGKHKH